MAVAVVMRLGSMECLYLLTRRKVPDCGCGAQGCHRRDRRQQHNSDALDDVAASHIPDPHLKPTCCPWTFQDRRHYTSFPLLPYVVHLPPSRLEPRLAEYKI